MPNRVLKSDVLGWGVDLDTSKRCGVPREANSESVTDVAGLDDRPKIVRQVPRVEILVSSEHKGLTPVFGTACPPHGLSGVFRRLAFRFSEGKKAHWIILLLADRIDVYETALMDFLRGRSHNPLTEMGLQVELRRGGFISRFGHNRADTRRLRQEIFLAGAVIMAVAFRTMRR